MEPDTVDVIVETHIEDSTNDNAGQARVLKSEPVDSSNVPPAPFIQRVVAVPPSVGSVEVWPTQFSESTEAANAPESANATNSQQSEQSNESKQYCCLLDSGKRCHRVAGNASFSRKINKMASQKGLKLCTDINCKHIYICDHHKNLIQRVRSAKVLRRQQHASDDENTGDSFRRGSNGAGGAETLPPADSAANRQLIESIVKSMSLQVLRRYRQAHKISGKAGNKIQLQELVVNHFESVPVNESEVVLRFFRVLRTNSNKLDQQLPNVPTTPVPLTPPASSAKSGAQGTNIAVTSSKNGSSTCTVPSSSTSSSQQQPVANVAVVPSIDSISDTQSGNPSLSWS